MTPSELDSLWLRVEDGDAAGVRPALETLATPTPPARLLRALARADLDDWAGARADLEALAAAEPTNPVARLNLALALYHTGEPRRAAALWKAGPFFPQPAYLRRYLRTFWAVRLGNPELCLAGVPAVPADWPHRAEVEAWRARAGASPDPRLAARLGAAAENAYWSGKALLAEQLLAAAAEIHPAEDTYAVSLCQAQWHLGRGAEVRARLEPILEREITRAHASNTPMTEAAPEVLSLWAATLMTTGDPRGALAVLSRVRPLGPDDYFAHVLAGLAWTTLGEHAKARAAFAPAFSTYLHDTWHRFLEPFTRNVTAWCDTR